MTSKYDYEDNEASQASPFVSDKKGKSVSRKVSPSQEQLNERNQPSQLSKQQNSRLKEYGTTGFTDNTLEAAG